MSLASAGPAARQAASEYAATTIRQALQWTSATMQERWYYVAGAVLLVILLWSYLRK